MKVEAITGRNDEAIMNFEKVKKDASGANVRVTIFRAQYLQGTLFYRLDLLIHLSSLIWMSTPCF